MHGARRQLLGIGQFQRERRDLARRDNLLRGMDNHFELRYQKPVSCHAVYHPDIAVVGLLGNGCIDIVGRHADHIGDRDTHHAIPLANCGYNHDDAKSATNLFLLAARNKSQIAEQSWVAA